MTTVDYYRTNAHDFYARTVSLDVESLYAPFLARLTPGSHILDAGCGSGRDTKAFHERGYIVTAFDAARELAELAAAHSGVPVMVMRFDEMSFEDEFDGIWACASLLHVPQAEMPDVFCRFVRALKPGSWWYLSFKYGDRQQVRNGRTFSDYTEQPFRQLVAHFPELEIAELYISADTRPRQFDERWLNAILHKKTE